MSRSKLCFTHGFGFFTQKILGGIIVTSNSILNTSTQTIYYIILLKDELTWMKHVEELCNMLHIYNRNLIGFSILKCWLVTEETLSKFKKAAEVLGIDCVITKEVEALKKEEVMSMSNSAILERIKQLKQRKQDFIEEHSGPEDNDDSFFDELEDIDYEIECWENVLEFGVANPYA